MPVHQRRRAFAVVGGDRIEDFKVLGRGFVQVAVVGEFLQPLHAGLIAQLFNGVHQPPVAQGLQQGLVEQPVAFQEGPDIPLRGGRDDGIGEDPEGFGIAVAELFRGFEHGRNLEHGADLEDLVQVLVRQLRNAESLVLDDFDDSQIRQVHDCLADRRNGDSQISGDLDDALHLPRRDFSDHDGGADRIARLLSEADGAEGSPAACSHTKCLPCPLGSVSIREPAG